MICYFCLTICDCLVIIRLLILCNKIEWSCIIEWEIKTPHNCLKHFLLRRNTAYNFSRSCLHWEHFTNVCIKSGTNPNVCAFYNIVFAFLFLYVIPSGARTRSPFSKTVNMRNHTRSVITPSPWQGYVVRT